MKARNRARSGDVAAAVTSPLRIMEAELGQPLPAIQAARAGDGRPYRRAQVLVRLHGWPLGIVNLDLEPERGTLDSASYRRRLWDALGPTIREHLELDGWQPVNELPAEGCAAARCAQALSVADPPLASVVVCTRDRAGYVTGCLQALLALAYPRFEIVLVDNAPTTPATAQIVRQRFGHVPHLRYVREDRPGLSNARNLGIQEARGEILAFTDDDVRVDPHWLTALVMAFGATPEVACVTGPILPAALETDVDMWVEEWVGGDMSFQRRVYDMTDHRDPSPLYPYSMGKFGAGASMAFRASSLHVLGGFDPALGAGTPIGGGEDLDMFFRVLSGGMMLVYEPSAIVRHLARPDYDGLVEQVRRNGVGFSAVLTKCLVDRPQRIVEVAARIPVGLAYLLRARARSEQQVSYPRELTYLELRGWALGPIAYLRSRRQVRKAALRATPVDW
jgi:GT2 family glycosyltransferase